MQIDHTKFKIAVLSSIADIIPEIWRDTNYINAVNTRLCLAYDKNALYALMRLLAYLVIIDANGKNNPQLFNDAMQWYQDALPLLDELKIPKAILKFYNPTGLPNNQLDARNQALIEQRLKQIRDSLHSRKNKLAGQAFNSQLRSLLTNMLTYFNSHSENALILISQKIHLLGVPQFGTLLGVQGKIETNDAREQLEEFVRSMGNKGLTLPPTKVAQLKTKSPDSYKEYNRLRAQFRNTLKLEIKRLVREHGDLIDANELKEKLDDMDLPTDFIPKGFVGYYDEDCNMYNKDKVQFASNQSGGTMKMNPNYDENVQGQAWIANGQTPQMQNPAMYYSKTWVVGKRSENKFSKVNENLANIEDIQKSWRKDMNSSDPQKQLNAMMIEALYRTGARMGNLNAQSKDKKTGKMVQTYGLSTLLVKHVRELANGGLNLIFAGKANMQHKLALRPDDKWSQMLIAYIKELCQDKRPSDFVFTMENGKRNQPANVNKALQDHGWAGTAHKLRHLLGSQLLLNLMEQKPLPTKADQAKTDAYVDKMMIAVGNALGHKRIIDGQVEPTGATARGSYIDPTLLIKLYRDRNLNLPRWLEKLENIKEEDEE